MKSGSFASILKKLADRNSEPISGGQIRGGEASTNQQQACSNGTCKGSINHLACTNSTNCTGSTNDGNSCANSITCFFG